MTPYQLISDADIHDYTAYIAKLAAVAAPGDPPPARFRTRFLWSHGSLPQDDLVSDDNAALYLRNQASSYSARHSAG